MEGGYVYASCWCFVSRYAGRERTGPGPAEDPDQAGGRAADRDLCPCRSEAHDGCNGVQQGVRRLRHDVAADRGRADAELDADALHAESHEPAAASELWADLLLRVWSVVRPGT